MLVLVVVGVGGAGAGQGEHSSAGGCTAGAMHVPECGSGGGQFCMRCGVQRRSGRRTRLSANAASALAMNTEGYMTGGSVKKGRASTSTAQGAGWWRWCLSWCLCAFLIVCV